MFCANVLLNLYRYNDETRNEFIKIIKFYKKRLWIPYQVGLEFHRRREEIMRKNAAAYKLLGDSISEQLVKVVDSLCSERDYARHPYINMKDIKNKVERLANAIKKSLEKQEKVRVELREHTKYYQYVLEENSNHLFLKCKNCGKSLNLKCQEFEDINKHIKKEHKFKLDFNTIIYGTCDNCSK